MQMIFKFYRGTPASCNDCLINRERVDDESDASEFSSRLHETLLQIIPLAIRFI